jgi:hypothetical protein
VKKPVAHHYSSEEAMMSFLNRMIEIDAEIALGEIKADGRRAMNELTHKCEFHARSIGQQRRHYKGKRNGK